MSQEIGLIQVGNYFLCLKDVIMKTPEHEKTYTKGKIYKSEILDCITDDLGNKNHYWYDECGPGTELFKKYFLQINLRKKKYKKLLNDTNLKEK